MRSLVGLQIGAVTGHRAQEHLFSIKSFIALIEWKNEAVALQQYDYSKMFDRENLLDGLNEAYKANVKGKLYKLLYELNKDRKIKVRTAVGDSEEVETAEFIGWGSSEGAIVSTINISKGIDDFLHSSEHRVS